MQFVGRVEPPCETRHCAGGDRRSYRFSFLDLRQGGRTADLDHVRTDPALNGPSTVARDANRYLVVNADFATSTTPFTVAGLAR